MRVGETGIRSTVARHCHSIGFRAVNLMCGARGTHSTIRGAT